MKTTRELVTQFDLMRFRGIDKVFPVAMSASIVACVSALANDGNVGLFTAASVLFLVETLETMGQYDIQDDINNEKAKEVKKDLLGALIAHKSELKSDGNLPSANL